MLNRGHWQHFQEAIRKLNESVPVVGQNEVLVLAPFPLAREDFLEHILPFLDRRNLACGLRRGGHGLPLEKGFYPQSQI